MSRLLVVGNINIETNLRVDDFPVPYQSATGVPFGIANGVSGVGYNLAKALATLGDEVKLASIIGQDMTGDMIRLKLERDGIGTEWVSSHAQQSPLSVVIYDKTGRRDTFFDVKDMMQQTYPVERVDAAVAEADAVLLTQIGYCRQFFAPLQKLNKLTGVDLQVITSLDDDYKRPFLELAHVAFMSNDDLPEPAESWIEKLMARYPTEIAVVGMGAHGALLATRTDNQIRHVPAIKTRPIVNTSGAGDSLYSSFMHFYVASGDPLLSLQKAVVFASYKIGAAVSSEGFLDAAGFDRLWAELGH